MQARLLSHHGRQAWVLDDQGQIRSCVYKGRDLQPTANDRVSIDSTEQPAVITNIEQRTNAITRSEAHRSKTLAANVDQAVIVVSGAPLFSDELLARMICACAAEGISGILVLNKTDLVEDTARARAQLAPFESSMELLEWNIVELAARPRDGERIAVGLDRLESALAAKASVVMGQSGMGKSSLLNALLPDFNARTQEISQALQTGKHTTTAGQVVPFHDNGWLIDTPGFQLFGLNHLSISQVALGFPEWHALQERLGRCRFANCQHANEPGCTVREAADRDKGLSRRRALWLAIVATL